MYWLYDWKGCYSNNQGVVFTLYMLVAGCLVGFHFLVIVFKLAMFYRTLKMTGETLKCIVYVIEFLMQVTLDQSKQYYVINYVLWWLENNLNLLVFRLIHLHISLELFNAMIILKYICYLKTNYDISQEVSFKFLKYLKNFMYWSFELGNEQFEPPPRHFYHIT